MAKKWLQIIGFNTSLAVHNEHVMKKLVLPDAVFTVVSALVLFGIVFFITTEPKNSNAVLRALGGRGGGRGGFGLKAPNLQMPLQKKIK